MHSSPVIVRHSDSTFQMICFADGRLKARVFSYFLLSSLASDNDPDTSPPRLHGVDDEGEWPVPPGHVGSLQSLSQDSLVRTKVSQTISSMETTCSMVQDSR